MTTNTSMFAISCDPDEVLINDAIESLLAEGVHFEEIVSRLNAALPGAMTDAGSILLMGLKNNAADMLSDRRGIRSGFHHRQHEKWGKPLDLLVMLIEAARESGQEFNSLLQNLPSSECDFVFNALRRLHARGCLVASEIHWMLEGGYASGAMARWRTLHELAVVSYFIKDHGQDVSEQYLLHHKAAAYQDAIHYNHHLAPRGFEVISDDVLQELKLLRDGLCARYGDAYKRVGMGLQCIECETSEFDSCNVHGDRECSFVGILPPSFQARV